MRIIGIDPGYAIVGFGVLDYRGVEFTTLEYGAILTEAHTDFPRRLQNIYEDMSFILERFKPDALAIEQLFFYSNKTTGIDVAQARGVILLSAVQHGVPIAEYTPSQVKQAVVGYGRAEKSQVMDMVRRLCNLKAPPKPDDAADAVALALCHARSSTSLLYRGEREECSTI